MNEPIRTIMDLRSRVRWFLPGASELAKESSLNLGGPSDDPDKALQYLETCAMETTEEGVVEEINGIKDLLKL